MTRITVKLTAKELELLSSLASDQLFRREFIDPRLPGYKSNPAELSLGKKLVERFRVMTDRTRGLPLSNRNRTNLMKIAKMQFLLTGFTHDMGFRVFAFDRIGEDRIRTRCTVRTDLALVRSMAYTYRNCRFCAGAFSTARRGGRDAILDLHRGGDAGLGYRARRAREEAANEEKIGA